MTLGNLKDIMRRNGFGEAANRLSKVDKQFCNWSVERIKYETCPADALANLFVFSKDLDAPEGPTLSDGQKIGYWDDVHARFSEAIKPANYWQELENAFKTKK